MRNSIKRFSKPRINSFNAGFDHQEDHLLLADIKVLPDDSRLTITPLNHEVDDEDNFDRLLADNNFGAIPSDLAQPDDSFAIIDQIPDTTGHVRPSDEHLNGPEIPFDKVPADFGQTVASNAIDLIGPDFEPAPIAITIKNDVDDEQIAILDLTPETAGIFTPTEPVWDTFENISANKSPGNTAALNATQNQTPSSRLMLYVACATLAITCLLGVKVYEMSAEISRLNAKMSALTEKVPAKPSVDENL